MEHLATPAISRVVLYGSHARGDFWDESDVDLAVVFSGEAPEPAERMRLSLLLATTASRVLEEMPILISPMPIWESDLSHPDAMANPAYYRNVLADGVVIKQFSR